MRPGSRRYAWHVGGEIRGIAQVVAFVDEPPVAARFWADALDAPQRLADGGALVLLPFAEFFFHPNDQERTPSGE